jgi:hypothetical protein
MSRKRNRTIAISLAVVAALSLSGTACNSGKSTHATKSTSHGLTVTIRSPADGTKIRGNVVLVEADVKALTSATTATNGGTGAPRLHLFVDKPPPAAGQAIGSPKWIVHFRGSKVRVPGLTVGKHKLSIVAGDSQSRRLGDVEVSVTVEVLGPALTVSAPRQTPAAEKAAIRVDLQGLTLSTQETQLAVFVDRQPTGPTQALPSGVLRTTDTAIPLTLPVGSHTIWVAAVNAKGFVSRPLVADRIGIVVKP